MKKEDLVDFSTKKHRIIVEPTTINIEIQRNPVTDAFYRAEVRGTYPKKTKRGVREGIKINKIFSKKEALLDFLKENKVI